MAFSKKTDVNAYMREYYKDPVRLEKRRKRNREWMRKNRKKRKSKK